jgi:hypothetical protein
VSSSEAVTKSQDEDEDEDEEDRTYHQEASPGQTSNQRKEAEKLQGNPGKKKK